MKKCDKTNNKTDRNMLENNSADYAVLSHRLLLFWSYSRWN